MAMRSFASYTITLLLGAACYAAPQPMQRAFATPQEAAQALVDAAAKNDTVALLRPFGPSGGDIVESGDAVQDKARRADFGRRAGEKLEIETEPSNPNRATVVVGQESWPLPVSLVHNNGQWSFDTSAGRMEVLARRVGRNELVAIDVCRAYVEAQMEYASRDRDGAATFHYAQRIASSSGKRDGLYWEGEPDNLVPKAFADAAAAMFAEGKKPEPYHGLLFPDPESARPGRAGRRRGLCGERPDDRRLRAGGLSSRV